MSSESKVVENFVMSDSLVFEKTKEDIFMVKVLRYAIPHAVSDLDSYWSNEEAQEILSDATFGYVWNSFSDVRDSLLNVAINVANGQSHRIKSITKDFSNSFLNNLYKEISDNENFEDNVLRIRLLPLVDVNFDYLTQLHKFSLDPDKSDLLDLWSRAGLSSSKDSALYDYLWSKVKREKGAIEIKANILERALKNDSLSGSLLKRLAKSSPKRLKRMITKDYSEKISSLERTRDRVKRSYDADNWEEMTKHFQEKIDKIEAKAMLFVDCTDYTVVDNLLDCLSRDNLPWLMPSASKHHWLSDRLQRKISD